MTPAGERRPGRAAVRQDEGIARLILLNGPPGVGKSTIARRYLEDHPLTLLIEIDELRLAIGGWDEHEESKLLARVLALALARAHLGAGHDVVLPQYLARAEFIDELQAVASEVGAQFRHVLLADARQATTQRFRIRRAELQAGGGVHPQADLAEGAIDAAIGEAERRLTDMAAERRDVSVVHLSAGDGYTGVLAALG
ncbi:MAG: AAA family ATPase [Actinomycetota bacterium]